jgi:hypothetical protein
VLFNVEKSHMKKFVQKIALIFYLSLGLSTTTPPKLNAASTKDNIELVTALLRGYAAYSEYELRNDNSPSAHVKRALISAVRLINDLCARNVVHNVGIVNDPVFFVYDSVQIVNNLCAALTADQQDSLQKDVSSTDDNERETLRRFVLPAIETLGALVRTRLIASSIPVVHVGLLMELTGASRCVQRFYAAPKNSTRRKIWGTLLVLLIIGVLVKIAMLSNPGNALVGGQQVRAVDVQQPQAQQNNGPALIRVYLKEKTECPSCKEDDCAEMCVAKCGHIYCLNCLRAWINQHHSCPTCRAEIPNADIAR